ncbi:hypothetical protein [Niabella hirudinis]|uniref:hypothetical protein n=1 Tax=Niabella hirudinis TaxID=1285929 RepID=UPI003EBE1446
MTLKKYEDVYTAPCYGVAQKVLTVILFRVGQDSTKALGLQIRDPLICYHEISGIKDSDAFRHQERTV